MATLAQIVAEKAGITEAQAQMAIKTVADFLKEKLPAPVAGQVDAVLTADASGIAAAAESVMKGLSGFMGKKEG
ncbi:MAG: DUF2267 domain-containing protein [Roseiflexus sp.]|nr:DUF2267 domain-containing protein [Roseiflexus sp.]MCS7287988.1 DUF2267 domain-containing protein [Roseiflexus sp.]MDW8234035.1 DUF2267 domain-containing protein [Roseiflexaceae bacterium]